MASSRSAHWSWRMISWMTKRRLLEGLLFAAAGTGAAINVVQFHKHGFALGWSNIWSMPAMAVWDGLALYRFRRKALARRQPGQAPARFYAVSVRGLTALAALLAGRKRPALRDEWKAHLAGERRVGKEGRYRGVT